MRWRALGGVVRQARIVVFRSATQRWQCMDCGAVVAHVDRHNNWHAMLQTDLERPKLR